MKKTDWKKSTDQELSKALIERAQVIVSARFNAAGAKTKGQNLRFVKHEIAQIKTEQTARITA